MGRRVRRTRDELKRALEIQLAAIASSAKAYDGGVEWEAVRLANAVYTILHDHGSIVSIATQLGIRGALRFFAGREYDPDNLMRETPLIRTVITIENGTALARSKPHLGDSPVATRRLQFAKWWDQDIILADKNHKISRKRLVFTLRNEEGGGHFSQEMNDESYKRFAHEHPYTPRLITQDSDQPILGVETATMRQIAWELTKTFEDFGPIE